MTTFNNSLTFFQYFFFSLSALLDTSEKVAQYFSLGKQNRTAKNEPLLTDLMFYLIFPTERRKQHTLSIVQVRTWTQLNNNNNNYYCCSTVSSGLDFQISINIILWQNAKCHCYINLGRQIFEEVKEHSTG